MLASKGAHGQSCVVLAVFGRVASPRNGQAVVMAFVSFVSFSCIGPCSGLVIAIRFLYITLPPHASF